MNRLIMAVSALSLIVVCVLSNPAQAKRSYPFQPGQRYVYEIYWTVIYAGTATIEVLPDVMHNGTRLRHFRATAKSSEFLDSMYKVRDRMDSYTDYEVNRFVKFRKNQNEGSYHRNFLTINDWDNGTSSRYGEHGFKNMLELPEQVLDPLSVLFAFRSHYLSIGKEVGGWVSDGENLADGRGIVTRRDRVDLDIGEYDAFVVEPEMKDVGGIFKEDPGSKIEIWFSTDDQRIPLRVKSSVTVGNIWVDLIRIEQVDPAEMEPGVNATEVFLEMAPGPTDQSIPDL